MRYDINEKAISIADLNTLIGRVPDRVPLSKNRVMLLLCALRDNGNQLLNTERNARTLKEYFNDVDHSTFSKFLDAVSTLASDNELSLLTEIQIQKSQPETTPGSAT